MAATTQASSVRVTAAVRRDVVQRFTVKRGLAVLIELCIAVACCFAALVPAWGQAPNTPSPRTVSDILAVLEDYKPDPARREKAIRDAAALPPNNGDAITLRNFYRARARAANRIGLVRQRIDDLRESARYGRTTGVFPYNILTELYNAELGGGNFLNAIAVMEEIANGARDWQAFESYTELASAYAFLGDTAQARQYLAKAEKARTDMSVAGKHHGVHGFFSRTHQFDARMEHARGDLLSSEGKFVEAEAAYRKAIAEAELDLETQGDRTQQFRSGEYEEDFKSVRDNYQRLLAVALMRQYRLSEAEIVARRVLTQTLRRTGRYSVDAANAVRLLASIVYEQGRYADAGLLAAAAVESFVNAGTTPESLNLAEARKVFGAAMVAQGRWSDALDNYDALFQGLQNDSELARRYGAGDIEWAFALIKTEQAPKAVAMLDDLLARRIGNLGEADIQVAEARGYLGIALAAQGSQELALIEFRRAVPLLFEQARTQEGSESGGIVRSMRLANILEAYLDLLGELYQARQGGRNLDALAESFSIADAARSSKVQRALAQSAARASLPDLSLAALARQEQDAQQRIDVLSDLLSRLLTAPANQQLPKVVAETRREIGNLRADRTKLRQEIAKRYPGYANLIIPKPASIEQARGVLRPGEALLSIYTDVNHTYVWAVAKEGVVAFVSTPIGRKRLLAMVEKLRRALDPGVTALRTVPPFDLVLAHDLYVEILEPVRAGWQGARRLVVTIHGPLAELPIALLVTRPVPQPEEREDALLFAGYRSAPFLARDVAITQIPSVSSLVTLRALATANVSRRPFVGFGDPLFNTTQVAEARRDSDKMQLASQAGSELQLRSAPATEAMASATLAALPRLPDTAAEVREVAVALHADPAQDVFLGTAANERQVRTMQLDDRKVVMFATHGLLPGDLDGLVQPALALTAPGIAGVDGDGLLTMDKILALKLDADWVVLSACNTASAQGAGAEAVSGLGRAFFYAGARSLLVTNWPVETTSARALTTALFRAQADNPKIARADALRAAMLSLLDGPGMIDADSGRPVFSYAHPIFWAPFSLVGDGG